MRRRQRPSSVTVLWDVRRTTLSIWNLVDKYFRWETEIESAAFRTWRKVRGGDTSMAGMAIAIPGVLNILETGYTMGKIRWHRGKKREKMAKKCIKRGKKLVSQFLPSLPKWSNAAPALFLHISSTFLPSLFVFSHFCLVSAIYLPIFLPFLPTFVSNMSQNSAIFALC